MNRHFTIESIQRTNKHLKRYSTSLVIKEVYIKTEDILAKMAKNESRRIPSVDKDLEQIKLSYLAGKSINCYNHLGKLVVSAKAEQIMYTLLPSNSNPRCIPSRNNWILSKCPTVE